MKYQRQLSKTKSLTCQKNAPVFLNSVNCFKNFHEFSKKGNFPRILLLNLTITDGIKKRVPSSVSIFQLKTHIQRRRNTKNDIMIQQ